MFPRSDLNAGRTRGTMIALRPNQLHCRKSAEFGRGSAFAELPLTLQPITVSPDVSDDSPVPFVPVLRKSGVSVTAVVDASGRRMIRKDFPGYTRGVTEYRVERRRQGDR